MYGFLMAYSCGPIWELSLNEGRSLTQGVAPLQRQPIFQWLVNGRVHRPSRFAWIKGSKCPKLPEAAPATAVRLNFFCPTCLPYFCSAMIPEMTSQRTSILLFMFDSSVSKESVLHRNVEESGANCPVVLLWGNWEFEESIFQSVSSGSIFDFSLEVRDPKHWRQESELAIC